jgi:hypothetical protein
MSGLRLDMARLGRMCLVWGPDMSDQTRSRALEKYIGSQDMNLHPNKLTTCKLNTTELREIKGTTRSNLNTKNHT